MKNKPVIIGVIVVAVLIIFLVTALSKASSEGDVVCPVMDERARLWNSLILNGRADEIGNRNCISGDYDEYWKICSEHICPNNITLVKRDGLWMCEVNATIQERS